VFRSLFDDMLGGFVYCKVHVDDGGRPCDFTFLAVNPGFERLSGLVGVVGKRASEVTPGIHDADPEMLQIYGRVSQTGRPERFERRSASLDRWFAVSAYCPKPEHFGAVFDDITDRKAAEEALREREALFRGLLEAAPHAMVIVDTHGAIQLVNARTEHLFGYAAAELLGTPVDRLLSEHMADRAAEAVLGFLGRARAGTSGDAMESRARRRDGSEFPVEITLGALATADGHLVTAAMRDLAAAKQAEAVRVKNLELELENQGVRKASRLTSELLAHMSHELRTPLNAIIGFGEILYDGQVEPLSPLYREFLGEILCRARHLRRVIDDLLEVEPDLDATLDPVRIKKVRSNYLSNALKATRARARAPGTDRLRVEVEDSGPGIAPADLPLLCTDFVQLEGPAGRARSGTGLGLALTKKLVEAQGGSPCVPTSRETRAGGARARHPGLGSSTGGGRRSPRPVVRPYPERHRKTPRISGHRGCVGQPLRISTAAFSAIMTAGALVLPPMMVGMIDASATRSPSTPRTRS
jgi:PAS domain S-box-containing protein